MALVEEGDAEFDEEAVERNDFQIQQLVEAFVDEPSIRHDEYPETESDSEAEDGTRQIQRRHIRRGDGELYENQTFFNGVAFKESVVDYVLRTGRNLKQYRYDKDKIGFRCVGGKREGESGPCEWQIYAAILPKDSIWKVRLFVDKHTCIPNGECEMMKVPVIARLFVDKIREEPNYFMPMKIEEIMSTRWDITVSRPQCQAARNKVLKWLESEYDHQFARLRDYAAEIVESNKDTVAEIVTVKNEKGEDLFDKFYVCFDVLRRTWFVKRLKTDLGLNDGEGYILVSDRQKGLISAVQIELPKIETIRNLAMARIAKRSVKSHDHKGICTPYVARFFEKERKKASECIINRSTNGQFEAKLHGCSYRINLEKRTCSCQKWDICGIPCEHAYGVILSKKLVPEDYVCHWFHTTMWKRNYTKGLVPVRGASFWPVTDTPNVHIPPEPDQPGKKKVTKADKKRKKGVNESPTKKQPKNKKRIMHCGICGQPDHNSRFHKKGTQVGSQVELSQGILTQVESSQVMDMM